jgi:hypothetical protein
VNYRSAWRWLLVAGCVAAATAQEKLLLVGPEPATIRLGETARVELSIIDPPGDPREFSLPKVDGLELRLRGPSQQLEQRFVGQSVVRRLSLAWVIELTPQREGVFVVPSFPVWTGSREQRTRELRLEAKKDLRGEELGFVEVTVEPRRVYVHEPIRVAVDVGVQQGLRLVQGRASTGQGYYDVEVQAGWLDEFPGGETMAMPAPAGSPALIVRGGNTLMQVVQDGEHERAGQRWLRFSFQRAYLPTRVGKLTLSAPLLRYHVVRPGGSPDPFGLRRGTMTEMYYATGKPVEIEVLPIPEQGRPTPFYGAVGRFQLSAALDRNQVKVGSSVKLTLTVQGSGNLEFLRLPELDALPGFHKLGQAEAKRDADKVVVTYDLTPLTTEVAAVPAVAWNYFDTTPGVERFVEVTTLPLPLAVRPLANGEALAPLDNASNKAVVPGVDDVFDLPEFGGEPAVAEVVPGWLGWLAMLLPWLLAAVAARWQSRRAAAAADVVGGRRKRAARTARQRLLAGDEPLDVLAGYLGDRLGVPAAAVIRADLGDQLVGAGLEPAVAAELAALVDRGTAARYGGGAPVDAAAVAAAVDRLERVRFGVAGWLPFLLLPVLWCGALPPLAAQGAPAQVAPTELAAAVAAYRAGDHAAADAAFAKLYETTGDRRLLMARGNCAWRLGDLPRALWAYESARLGLPRDRELLANLRLVRSRLEVGADAGFAAEVAALLTSLTAREQLGLGAACMVLAVAGCWFWRRWLTARWLGALALVLGLSLFAELLWLQPMRPPMAIALRSLELASEPRAGLPAIATVRGGVSLVVLGGTEGAFVRVRAADRIGFVARDAMALVQ